MREHAYARVLADTVEHGITGAPEIHIYHAPADMHRPASEMRPVLLSYVDVVVQGYLHEFGEDGVARFFETTDGWNAPMKNDRAEPAAEVGGDGAGGRLAGADWCQAGLSVGSGRFDSMARGACSPVHPPCTYRATG